MAVKVLSSLMTPLLGIIGAIILILQYTLSKRRWRLDLYDKRYPAYLGTMELIAAVTQRGNISDDELRKFARGSSDKEFLFGEEIQVFMKTLHDKAVDIQTLNLELDACDTEIERKRLIRNRSQLCKWFGDQFQSARKLFGEYLSITKK
jgi:hypothetical protein